MSFSIKLQQHLPVCKFILSIRIWLNSITSCLTCFYFSKPPAINMALVHPIKPEWDKPDKAVHHFSSTSSFSFRSIQADHYSLNRFVEKVSLELNCILEGEKMLIRSSNKWKRWEFFGTVNLYI